MKQKKSIKNLFQEAETFFRGKQLQEAEKNCRQILKKQRDNAQANNLLGLILQNKGDHQGAIILFNKALKKKKMEPVYHYNLGVSLLELKQYALAKKSLQFTVARAPQYAPAFINLGVSYLEEGFLQEAKKTLLKALQLAPEHGTAHSNMALVFDLLGERELAVLHYQKAISLDPANPHSYSNLGKLLNASGQAIQAISFLYQAIQLDPGYAKAHSNLGDALSALGDTEQAISCYRRAMECDPEYVIAHSNLLLCLHYSSEQSRDAIYGEHLNWAVKHCPSKDENIHHSNSAEPGRKIRVGYLSPDFRRHSVAFFIEPILANHTNEQYKIFCYSNLQTPDKTSKRIKGLVADGWRDVFGLSNDELARLVRQDEIDILVDLTGHSAHNRLSVFAMKPAPVQVTYLGYPDTTGLSAMDYRITDEWADPVGSTETLHSEELCRLAGGFLCYQPPEICPPCPPLPMTVNKGVTFGSFNILPKLSHKTIAVWAKILTLLPESRLVLKARSLEAEAVTRLEQIFAGHGIEKERIRCLPFSSTLTEHLQCYGQIDIALDPFPYNGTTTTFEALWMGRPVVALAGDSHVSRVGCSILSRLGHQELIAESREDYCQLAVDLARDKDRCVAIHTSLRKDMMSSGLLDGKALTIELEKCYRKVWHQWCKKTKII